MVEEAIAAEKAVKDKPTTSQVAPHKQSTEVCALHSETVGVT